MSAFVQPPCLHIAVGVEIVPAGNADGYMETGWLNEGGHWYYLHPYSDGTQGYMYTGWHEIGGKWYFFNTVSGGPLGSMAAGTTTTDGYTVGADGAWIR